MLTPATFHEKWQSLHHPSMDVDGDAAFYLRVYGQLYLLATREVPRPDESLLFRLSLYTENIIAIGLDGVYEYMYRGLGDMVVRWCEELDMRAGTTSLMRDGISRAVAEAPRSALRQWMKACVLSRDPYRLRDMLTWFARHDQALRGVYPTPRYREALFRQLTGDDKTITGRMLWTDLAFNWQDKHGATLAQTLAGQFMETSPLTTGESETEARMAADNLRSIRSWQTDIYLPETSNERHTLTLHGRDGHVFPDVIFPMGIPASPCRQHVITQLVSYLGQTYAVNPLWCPPDGKKLRTYRDETYHTNGRRTEMPKNFPALWADIREKEREAARHEYFITPFGKRVSRYDDLYVLPEDPEEAYYADMGIYRDEPNILDFLR